MKIGLRVPRFKWPGGPASTSEMLAAFLAPRRALPSADTGTLVRVRLK